MSPDFSNHIVVITNGAQGMGVQVARRFAQAGATVIATAPQSAGIDSLAALNANVSAIQFEPLNLRDANAGAALVERVVSQHNQIDVWVNIVDLAQVTPAESISLSEWDESIATCLSGTFYCCQSVGKQMLARGRGVIVNVVSVNALKVIEGHAASATTEAGVLMLTQALGVEWSKRGVRVVGVAVGPAETDSPQKFCASGEYDAGSLAQRIPMHRLGSPQQVTDTVLFIASDQASFITAETVRVDGGWTAYQLF